MLLGGLRMQGTTSVRLQVLGSTWNLVNKHEVSFKSLSPDAPGLTSVRLDVELAVEVILVGLSLIHI